MGPRSVIGLVLVVACVGVEPVVSSPDATPDDLRALVDETFDVFVDAFPARRHCIGAVTVLGRRDLSDRGTYDPESRTVTLRIPATAPQLEVSLVHELAHHLESACSDHVPIRPAFMAAQGFGPETPWRPQGATWEEIPSEHWASAIVIHVLGRIDDRARIVVSARSIELVEAWATDLTPGAP
jgi:hypothetical protein